MQYTNTNTANLERIIHSKLITAIYKDSKDNKDGQNKKDNLARMIQWRLGNAIHNDNKDNKDDKDNKDSLARIIQRMLGNAIIKYKYEYS